MAKRKEEEPSGGLPAWMGTYGDMVTLLLCFFVLLFSMSSVDVAKFKAAISAFNNQIDVMPGGEALTEGELTNNGVSQLNDIAVVFSGGMPINTDEKSQESESQEEKDQQDQAKEVAEEIEALLEEENIGEQVKIAYTPNYVKLTMQGEILYDSAKADLKPKAVETIDVIAEILDQSDYADYSIQIEGHTDNVPINTTQFPSNRHLSAARAIAVEEALVEVHGYEDSRVSSTGYGANYPVASNETEEGRALNRRVEIKILLQTQETILDEEVSLEE